MPAKKEPGPLCKHAVSQHTSGSRATHARLCPSPRATNLHIIAAGPAKLQHFTPPSARITRKCEGLVVPISTLAFGSPALARGVGVDRATHVGLRRV
eukprot:7219193-Alexandrium_andersonii.AAC.1